MNIRDFVTVENENGEEQQFAIEALFDMEDRTYALLQGDEALLLMRLEGDADDQYLVGIEDQDEAESILSAYQIAVEAAPAEQ